MAISFKLEGYPDQIIKAIREQHPEVETALDRARENVPFIKREIARYQAALLYALARSYNRPGARFLEIGTAWGYSAAVMAEAAPEANIVTLNPKVSEFERAMMHLQAYRNVMPLMTYSWDYWKQDGAQAWDLIFVDGDHNQVDRDLPWWDRLSPGGLFVFHDYAPDGAGRPCQPVYEAINTWMAEKGLKPDVLVVDHANVGMIGFVRE